VFGGDKPAHRLGPTRLYYADIFEKEGKLVELKGTSIGYGEEDKAGVMIAWPDSIYAGVRVFPMTEFVKCIDLDHRENEMTLKDIRGEVRLLMPKLHFIGTPRFTDPSELPDLDPEDERFAKDTSDEFDTEHIPTGKYVTMCFTLNIHPQLDDKFLLLRRSSAREDVIHTYKVDDPHSLNPCEPMIFEKAGNHMLYLRWWMYSVESNRLLVKAVDK